MSDVRCGTCGEDAKLNADGTWQSPVCYTLIAAPISETPIFDETTQHATVSVDAHIAVGSVDGHTVITGD